MVWNFRELIKGQAGTYHVVIVQPGKNANRYNVFDQVPVLQHFGGFGAEEGVEEGASRVRSGGSGGRLGSNRSRGRGGGGWESWVVAHVGNGSLGKAPLAEAKESARRGR
jgi:hypothetical protein